LTQYRIAIATTGEYYLTRGNSRSKILENVVKIVNQIDAIFVRDLSISLQLVENTDTLFFPNGADDPYSNGTASTLLAENTSVINDLIGSGNYDVGHVLGTNTGGVALLNSVCTGSKGAGSSNTFGIYSSSLFYLIVAHELGHQFGATHSFNFCDNENEFSGTAYEPGSGSTIMCYSGASNCGQNYIQNVNDPYFHAIAINQITSFIKKGNGAGCGTRIPMPNSAPEINILAPSFLSIPIFTPFQLTGDATDADGDTMTYNWDQFNLGPKSPLGRPINDAPSFRSVSPNESPTRYFPNLQSILTKNFSLNEVLPEKERKLTFKFVVRDNHLGAGLVSQKEISFRSDPSAGPFKITFPTDNTDFLNGGEFAEINWDVANTDNEVVNCRKVNIMLSTDGGQSFPISLIENTNNDGSEFLFVPNLATTKARIKIEAADNIFFAISDSDITIKEPSSAGFSVGVTPNTGIICIPDSTIFEIKTASVLDFKQKVRLEILENNHSEVDLVLNTDSLNPGENAFVNASFSENFKDDRLQFSIMAFVPGVDTFIRSIDLEIFSSNFQNLSLLEPGLGSLSNSLLPDLVWSKVEDADYYDVRLSSSPEFADGNSDFIYEVVDTIHRPLFTLKENSIYYWQVRAINSCKIGDWSPVSAFFTKIQLCEEKSSNDTPILISATGTPTIESKINFDEEWIVTDVNIPLVEGLRQFVGDLEVSIISPDGTSSILFNRQCANLSDFALGFDDQAPREISCPLTTFLTHVPQEPLSIFNEKVHQGDWTLRVKVRNGGESGSLQSWRLELCTDLNVNPPSIAKNDTLKVGPGQSKTISSNELLASDPDNEAIELIYTLVTIPKFGYLIKNQDTLKIGNQFTQADIDNFQLKYLNKDTLQVNDQFSFTVSDGFGGWVAIPVFNIRMDASFSVSVSTSTFSESIKLFPNPNNGSFKIEIDDNLISNGIWMIQSIDGKSHLLGSFSNSRFEVENKLAPGIYTFHIQSSQGIGTKKFSVINTD
jgi:subtilisin-like proprotein convertase family protein